jgi:ribosome recycling factor
LARKAADIGEKAKTSIRASRHQGQKRLKQDIENKIVGDSDGHKEAKEVKRTHVSRFIPHFSFLLLLIYPSLEVG